MDQLTIPAHLDTDAEPKAKPTLLSLPEHVLYQIATYGDEKSVWRVMATCRAWRAAAERALDPHLGELEVVVLPRLFEDIYTPPSVPEEADEERCHGLQTRSEHIIAFHRDYPRALELLRRCTVELYYDTINDLYMPSDFCGADLEQLTVHYRDRAVYVSESDEDDDPLDDLVAYHILFPNLTHLTIAATTRTHAYFDSYANSVPALRELTLVAHNRDGLEPYWGAEDALRPIKRFEHLERITLSGDDVMVLAMLSTFAANFSTLLYVTLYTPDASSESIGVTITHYLSQCPRLKGLALITPNRDNVLSTLAFMHTQDIDDDHVDVSHDDLEMLVLEGSDLSWLSKDSGFWVEFPCLERITFVDPAAGASIRKQDVLPLFECYDTLKRIEWTAERPVDPFGPVETKGRGKAHDRP